MDNGNRHGQKGMLIIYTGNGKGKTTAALGLCVRASGYGLKVAIIQFIKGSWQSGETEGVKKLAPDIELYRLGKGFVGILDDSLPKSEHERAAFEALEFAKELMLSDKYDIIILDELNVAIENGLVKLADVFKFLENKPEKLDVIITGCGAHPRLIEMADLVTEMKEIKHPFQKGISAKKGIDY